MKTIFTCDKHILLRPTKHQGALISVERKCLVRLHKGTHFFFYHSTYVVDPM